MTAQLLIVSAGARRFGLDLDAVAEIVERVAVTSLPLLPRAVAGVVEVRGQVVPLIDLAALEGGRAPHRDRAAVVVASDGVRPFAMLIDEVEGIVDAAESGDAAVVDLPRLFEGIA